MTGPFPGTYESRDCGPAMCTALQAQQGQGLVHVQLRDPAVPLPAPALGALIDCHGSLAMTANVLPLTLDLTLGKCDPVFPPLSAKRAAPMLTFSVNP